MTVRVLVIGAGAFGVEHLRVYADMSDVQIVGVSDANSERAHDVARQFGTVSVEPGSVETDAVSLVVPAHSRGALTADLIDSGVAVFIEKPLAPTAPAAEALVRGARDRVAMVGHVLRFAAPYRQLAAASLEVGQLRTGHLSRRRSASHARLHPSDDVIGLTMIHDLDAVSWLSRARPVAVAATGLRGPDGRWVQCQATVSLDDGTRWTVHAEWARGRDDHEDVARLEGQHGEASIVVSGVTAEATYGDALASELRHFIDHTVAGTPSSVLRMADAALAVRLADAVRSSLDRKGDEVELAH